MASPQLPVLCPHFPAVLIGLIGTVRWLIMRNRLISLIMCHGATSSGKGGVCQRGIHYRGGEGGGGGGGEGWGERGGALGQSFFRKSYNSTYPESLLLCHMELYVPSRLYDPPTGVLRHSLCFPYNIYSPVDAPCGVYEKVTWLNFTRVWSPYSGSCKGGSRRDVHCSYR